MILGSELNKMSNYKCMNCMEEYDDSISSYCPYCGHDKFEPIDKNGILLPGTTLKDRYLLGNKISEENSGFVYVAWDNFFNCKVKIKEFYIKEYCSRLNGTTDVIVPSSLKSKFEKGRDIFLQRGEKFMSVSKNIQTLAETKDCFIENQTAYIVIEYVDGSSVADVVSTSTMNWGSFSKVIKHVIAALAQLHNLGCTVQSIRPENIVVTSDRRIKIINYDCLNDNKVISSKSSISEQDSYSPIELYRSGSMITAACDVYSVASVIYRTITGIEVPSSSERAKSDKLIVPSSLTEIDEDVENALLNALEVEPKSRTNNCDIFYNELFGTKKVERNASGIDKKKSKKIIVIVSIVAVLLVAGFVTAFSLLSAPDSYTQEEITQIGKIPNLQDLTLKEAKKEIKALNKKLKEQNDELVITVVADKETIKDSDKKKDGKIALQTPKADQAISDNDEKITITVKLYSYDPDEEMLDDRKLTMPNVVEKSEEEAKEMLNDAGFENVKIGSYIYSENVESGKVIYQNKSAGSSVEAKTEIILTISKGPQPTTAPATAAPSKQPSATPSKPSSTTPSTSKASNEVNQNNQKLW